jgi:hypothetical protein
MTPECLQRNRSWQSDAASAREEAELIERINELRSSPRQICKFGLPVQALKPDDALQCAARLRFSQSNPPRGSGGPPLFSYGASVGPEAQRELQDRAERAGVSGGVIEVIVTGADTAEDVFNGVMGALNKDEICFAMAYESSTQVGVAHTGNVWVVDFGLPTRNSPAHSGPNPGDH